MPRTSPVRCELGAPVLPVSWLCANLARSSPVPWRYVSNGARREPQLVCFAEFRDPNILAPRSLTPVPVTMSFKNLARARPHKLGVFTDAQHSSRLRDRMLEMPQEIPGGIDYGNHQVRNPVPLAQEHAVGV